MNTTSERYTEADVERCERAMVEAVDTGMDGKDDLEFSKACVRAVLDAFTSSDAARIATLGAEVEKYKVDAERYRWLTRFAYVIDCYTHDGTVREIAGCDRQVPSGYTNVHQAIDAARSRT